MDYSKFSKDELIKEIKNLKETERIYKEVFENLDLGVAIYKPIDGGKNFKFIGMNKTGEKFSQVKLKDILNKKVTEIFPSIKDIGLFDIFTKVYKDGKSRYLNKREYKDNRIREWVTNYVYRLSLNEIVAIYNDVTEKHKLENELQNLNIELTSKLQRNEYLNHILITIKDIHKIIIKEKNINRLLSDSCNILIKNNYFSYAFAILFEKDKNFIFEARDNFDFSLKECSNNKEFDKCINRLLFDLKNRNLIYSKLSYDSNKYGFFGIITTQKDISNITEKEVISELANDLSFAIYNSKIEKRTQELEFIIDNSPIIVFLWQNRDGWPVEFVSKNITKFGYTPNEFYKREVEYTKIIYEEDLERVGQEVTYYSKNNFKEFKQEYRIYSKDRKKIYWIDDRTWIRRNQKGEITHYQGIIFDITKQKEAKLKVLFHKNYLQTIFDTAQNIILTTLNGNSIIEANMAFFKFLSEYESIKEFRKNYGCICDLFERVDKDGYLSKEINGEIWTNYIIKNRNKTHKALIKRNGKNYIFKVNANKMPMDIYNENRIVVSLTDISELEEYKNKLESKVAYEIEKQREQEQLLIEQNKLASLGELLKAIAHQWRQPLNAVGLKVQLLVELYEDGDLDINELRERVDSIMNQINFMSKTIDDFRDFFKPAQKFETFDIKKILNSAYKLLSAQFEFLNVEFKFSSSDEEFLIKGDKNQFKQVILNVLNNSKDAIEEARIKDNLSEKEKGFILVELLKDDEVNILKVWDNGGEASSEVLEKMFHPYFSTKEEGKGIGMGLYMSKIIIEKNLNGEIFAKNRDGGVEIIIKL